MTFDPARATFVSREYRYEDAEDVSVKANHVSAKEVVFDTQLSAASAATLAAMYLNDTKTLAQAYEVVIEGALQLEDFEGGPPRYLLDAPSFMTDGRISKVASATIDPMANTTTLTVRG